MFAAKLSFGKVILSVLMLTAFVAAPLEATASKSGKDMSVRLAKKKVAKKKAKNKKHREKKQSSVKAPKERFPAETGPKAVDVNMAKVARVLPPKMVDAREPISIPIQSEFNKTDPNL